MKREGNQQQVHGWVLYDGRCELCAKGVDIFGRTLERYHFKHVPLQDPWVGEQVTCSEEELMSEMKLLTPEKQLLGGVDAYRYIAKKIWWAWPLYVFSGIPGLRQLCDWLYARIARNRYTISRVCRIHADAGLEDKISE